VSEVKEMKPLQELKPCSLE